MQDRIPLHPGRVKLTQVSGNIYDMERADEPQQAGTPLNKSNLFDSSNESRYSASTPNEALSLLVKEWTISLAISDWSSTQTSGFYTATKAVTGMKSVYNPIFYLVPTNAATIEDEEDAFGTIKMMITNDGSVTFRALDVPLANITIKVKGV